MGWWHKYGYSDMEELNLDSWIQKIAKLEIDMKEVMDLLNKIKILTPEEIQKMIDDSITTNNRTIQEWLNILKIDITNDYKAYCTELEASIKRYVDQRDLYYDAYAQGYAAAARLQAEQYADQLLHNYMYMYDPITGELDDVRVVVQHVIEYYHGNDMLTAAEYDALDLTATAFEAYNITAVEYDMSGKTILV